jgi:hypothetical protein
VALCIPVLLFGSLAASELVKWPDAKAQAERATKGQQKAATQEKQSAPPSTLVNKRPSPDVNRRTDHSAKEENKTDEAIAEYTFWLTAFTGILAIATVGLAVYTARLHAATAGLKSLAESQEKLTKTIQRAHVWADIGSIRSLTGEPGFVPRIVIRNSGHLPAKGVGWAFGDAHFTTDNEWKPPSPLPTPGGDITLAAGASMTHGGRTLYIKKGDHPPKTYLYVWGCVTYWDGIANHQITQFCHRYSLDRLWWDKEGHGLRVFAKQHQRFNRHHNDAT